jgi:hypothetical protein
MKKKPAPNKRKQTSLRFDTDQERERFKLAAKKEGFTTLSSWAMWHLRKAVKETLGE